MITVSISDLQRKMNKLIIPRINSGETVQVIDKKTGVVKFHITPVNNREKEADWSCLDERIIKPKAGSEKKINKIFKDMRSDKSF